MYLLFFLLGDFRGTATDGLLCSSCSVVAGMPLQHLLQSRVPEEFQDSSGVWGRQFRLFNLGLTQIFESVGYQTPAVGEDMNGGFVLLP